MDWLFIGSSSSVLETLPQARADFPAAVLITCNAGILLCPEPDYYAAIDMGASVYYADLARQAQRSGTQLITLWRDSMRTREERCITHYDQFLHLSDHNAPTRESWGCFKYTGPMCMEFALRHGAQRMVLVGCDGYQGDGDYFSEEPCRKFQENRAQRFEDSTKENIQRRTQELVNVWPEVEWIIYGKPCYTISGKWEVRTWTPTTVGPNS